MNIFNKTFLSFFTSKKKFLIPLFSLLLIFTSFWIYELNRPPDLRDLTPSDYSDNPELMLYAEKLKSSANPSDIISEHPESDAVLEDSRFIDILILCMHERESILSRICRFLIDLFDTFSIKNTLRIPSDFASFMSEDNKSDIRSDALFRLSYMDEKGLPAINVVTNLLLNDPDFRVRYRAFNALGSIGSSESFPLMLQLIENDHFKGNLNLSSPLRQVLKNEKHRDLLVQKLDSKNDKLRLVCIQIFAWERTTKENHLRLQKKIDYIIKNDPCENVRIACITWMRNRSEIYDQFPMLLEVYRKDKSEAVRAECIRALWWLADKKQKDEAAGIVVALLGDPNESEIVRMSAIETLDDYGPAARTVLKSNGILNKLLSIAKDKKESKSIRNACFEVLCSMEDKEIYGHLIEIYQLKETNKELNLLDFKNISRIRDPRIFSFLLRIYDKPEYEDYLSYIIKGLCDAATKEEIPFLLKLIEDERYKPYRIGICNSLTEMKDERVIPACIKVMKSMNEDQIYTKSGFINELTWSDSPALKEYIYSFLKAKRSCDGDRSIFDKICWYYHKWLGEDQAFTLLSAIAEDPQELPETRCSAIIGMFKSKNPKAKNIILRILNNEKTPLTTRLTAAEYLFWFKEYSGLDIILKSLSNDDEIIRRKALGCLFQFHDNNRAIPALQKMHMNEKQYELKAEIEKLIQDFKKRREKTK